MPNSQTQLFVCDLFIKKKYHFSNNKFLLFNLQKKQEITEIPPHNLKSGECKAFT